MGNDFNQIILVTDKNDLPQSHTSQTVPHNQRKLRESCILLLVENSVRKRATSQTIGGGVGVGGEGVGATEAGDGRI